MLEIDDELLLDIRAGGLADLRIAYRPSFLDGMLAAERSPRPSAPIVADDLDARGRSPCVIKDPCHR
jgi:hypothetical protein